ncbi:MAG TPA: alpha/beta hydrolase [Candidatus Polarisedimenticolia bacterium]|nr:alpha/beta hydrolase [Candidatus Polarisedimenticolia bacterium]
MRKMRRLLLILAVSTVAAAAAAFGIGSWILMPASGPWKGTAAPSGSREVSFTASDGVVLKGWWWPAGDRADAVLLLHDLGANRLEMMPRASWLHDAGYGVLLFDFRGCGESSGRMSGGFAERLDVASALSFLKEHAAGVVLQGKGAGASAAVMAVDDWQGVRAAVLEQMPDRFDTSVRAKVRARTGPLASLLSPLVLMQVRPRLGFTPSELAPVERLGRARCPVLLGYGALDETIPASSMSALFHAGPYPTTLWILQKAGREDLFEFDPAAYKKKVAEFLAPIESPGKEGS